MLLFILVPIAEIYVIIQVGHAIGALNTVALLVAVSFFGAWLMKREGLGTLRRAATYPEAAESRGGEEIARALKKVGLGHLVERLDEDAPWDQILSSGEKQR